jgi:hypothetical protein
MSSDPARDALRLFKLALDPGTTPAEARTAALACLQKAQRAGLVLAHPDDITTEPTLEEAIEAGEKIGKTVVETLEGLVGAGERIRGVVGQVGQARRERAARR